MVCIEKERDKDFGSFVPNDNSWKELTRLVNVEFKNKMKELNMIEFGRLKKYFDFKISHSLIQHNIQVYDGFKLSCDYYKGGLKIMIDSCCKIMSSKNLWQEFLDEKIS